MQRRARIGMALASLLLAACNNASTGAPTDSPDEAVQQQLLGTWLREFEEDGIRVRRILVLEPDDQARAFPFCATCSFQRRRWLAPKMRDCLSAGRHRPPAAQFLRALARRTAAPQ